MEIRGIYIMSKNFEKYLGKLHTSGFYLDSRNRRYELICVADGYAYLTNIKAGNSLNIPVNDFKEDFHLFV